MSRSFSWRLASGVVYVLHSFVTTTIAASGVAIFTDMSTIVSVTPLRNVERAWAMPVRRRTFTERVVKLFASFGGRR